MILDYGSINNALKILKQNIQHFINKNTHLAPSKWIENRSFSSIRYPFCMIHRSIYSLTTVHVSNVISSYIMELFLYNFTIAKLFIHLGFQLKSICFYFASNFMKRLIKSIHIPSPIRDSDSCKRVQNHNLLRSLGGE